MPFSRPTLTALRNQTAQDLNANLPGADALLRFSNLRVLGDIQAALAHMLYGSRYRLDGCGGYRIRGRCGH